MVDLVGSYSNLALQSQNLRDLRERINGTQIKIRVISKPKPGRQKQKRLSPAQLEGLVEDYRSGMPLREIAFKYQVHRDTANNHVRRMGLPSRYPKRTQPPLE